MPTCSPRSRGGREHLPRGPSHLAPRTKSSFPSPAVTRWFESWPNPPRPWSARRQGVTDARLPVRDSGDSPARGQDALLVGAVPDAAHAHGVSATEGQGLSKRQARAPLQGAVRAGAGLASRAGLRPLDDLPLAAEHGGTGRPGVPAFQQAIVPPCGNTNSQWRQHG